MWSWAEVILSVRRIGLLEAYHCRPIHPQVCCYYHHHRRRRSLIKMSEAPRRSARNAGKPAPAAPAAAPAAKRKSAGDAGAAEKKAKPTPATAAAAKPAKASPDGALKVGDKLPSFKLKLQDGKDIDTASLKKVVIFS